MQTPEKNDQQDAPEQAPPALVHALKQAFTEKPFVPATVDEAILRAARTRLQPAPRPRRSWLPLVRWAAGLGAAAACVWLAANWAERTAVSRFARADVNRDGRVDILDAFALSKALESGTKLSPRLDLNGDGKVDRADVAFISAQAVRLSQTDRACAPSGASAPGNLQTSFLVITPKAYR